jgi:hypothetical protein
MRRRERESVCGTGVLVWGLVRSWVMIERKRVLGWGGRGWFWRMGLD